MLVQFSDKPMHPLGATAPNVMGAGCTPARVSAYSSDRLTKVVGEHHAAALIQAGHTAPTAMKPPGTTVKFSAAPVLSAQ